MPTMNSKRFSSKDAVRLTDEPTRDLLLKIMQYLESAPILSYGFVFAEGTVPAGTTNIPHSLGYAPKDIILTSNSTSASVTINYSLSDERNISVTSSAQTTLRFLVGTFGSIK